MPENTTGIISFHHLDKPFKPAKIQNLRAWLQHAIETEHKSVGPIAFIFCTDAELLKVNRQYLNHDDYTDVITFDYGQDKLVSGDIFISQERVRENAKSLGTPMPDELHRVMIHGVLHLCGYKDKQASEKTVMTSKEDYYLSLRTF